MFFDFYEINDAVYVNFYSDVSPVKIVEKYFKTLSRKLEIFRKF
jgi:hypothetical protein